MAVSERDVHIVFGGAGFIGCNLIQKLLLNSVVEVVCVDNQSRGNASHLVKFLHSERLKFLEIDVADYDSLSNAFKDCDFSSHRVTVWHLAANSDIPAGVSDVTVDLKDTFITTVNILRWMKLCGHLNFCFASSSAIYGDHGDNLLHEEVGNCHPISNYGAMKLASEAVISAACEDFLLNAYVFRFPNVVGTPATHGVIYDFVKKLNADQRMLHVLGDGSQKKAYLHVRDLIDAMTFIAAHDCDEKAFKVYNIGPFDDGIHVRDIAQIVSNLYSPRPKVEFGSGKKGWVGDVPKFKYSTNKLRKLGWRPTMGSMAAIELSAKQIYEQLYSEKR